MKMHRPGIEPGPPAWQASIFRRLLGWQSRLPLVPIFFNFFCFQVYFSVVIVQTSYYKTLVHLICGFSSASLVWKCLNFCFEFYAVAYLACRLLLLSASVEWNFQNSIHQSHLLSIIGVLLHLVTTYRWLRLASGRVEMSVPSTEPSGQSSIRVTSPAI